MENNQEYYSNFKCYNNKLQRLAIFGREKEGMLEVFILKCSKSDQFNKDLAKRVYDCHIGVRKKISWYNDFHPIIQNVVIEEGDSAKYTFKKYCELFYKLKERLVTYKELCLVGDDSIISLQNTAKRINKLDR